MIRHFCRRVGIFAVVVGFAASGVGAQQPQATRQPEEVESVMMPEVGTISVRQLATGLEHPWGMAFLPDGRLLVTERAGRLRILDPQANQLSDPVEGVPQVWAQGQGGLMDVALDPNFSDNQFIYLSYAKPGENGTATTALGRGRFVEDRIEGFEDIFIEMPYVEGSAHFGNRIVFDDQGHLFLALGERFQFDPAQDLSSHLGSIIRIHPDGSVPEDNPFVGREDAKPEIWSYGHRNIESAAIDPRTGQLWVAEMGPLGGDELNLIEKEANYGWPIVSWGADYDGSDRPDPPTRPEFKDAVKVWTPVISPSGMMFYTGDVFPAWQNRMFIGGLSARELVIVDLQDGQVASEERIPLPERIRDVEQGPDGMIYVLVDKEDGHVWRLEPLGQ